MIFSILYGISPVSILNLAENSHLISLSVIYHHLQINPPGFVAEKLVIKNKTILIRKRERFTCAICKNNLRYYSRISKLGYNFLKLCNI